MNDNSPQQNETVMASEKPGTLLREARLKQDLTVDDIYKRIHLEPRIIEAIEADDFSKIPTATYARGYLRTYAKTLGLDGDHIVSLYNVDNEPPLPEILPEVKPPSQVSSSDKPVKAFTYLVSLALVLLLLIWYQSNFVVDKKPDAEEAAAQQDVVLPDQINNTDTDFDVVIHPDGWQSPEAPEPEPLMEVMSELTSQTADSANPLVESETTTVADTEQPDILSVDSAETTRTYVSTGTDTIELNISQDSWIEIYDVNDERVFMDLGQVGETIQIKGTAPFSLILGYSPGVALKFNDETFDPEPYSNNGVARFQLPPE